MLAEAKKQGAVIGWGSFLTAAVNFLIIAFVLFLAVRAINSLKRSDAAPPPAPSKSETLLEEIRDALPSKAARPPKPLRSKSRRSASNYFLNKFATRSLKGDLRSPERRRLKRGGTRTTGAR